MSEITGVEVNRWEAAEAWEWDITAKWVRLRLVERLREKGLVIIRPNVMPPSPDRENTFDPDGHP